MKQQHDRIAEALLLSRPSVLNGQEVSEARRFLRIERVLIGRDDPDLVEPEVLRLRPCRLQCC